MTQATDTPVPSALSAVSWLSAACALCAFAVAFGFCVWAVHRGFEITDEAYYLLMGMHPEGVQLYVSAQQWVTGPLWATTGSLVAFRTCGLLLLVGSAATLSHGVCSSFCRYASGFEVGVASQISVASASIVFALLYAATINLSPSYNLLASAGANAAAGFVLLGLCASASLRRHEFNLLAGLALAVEFVGKPSAGVATFAVVGFWLMSVGSRSLKAKLVDVVVVGLGAVVCVAMLASTQSSMTDVVLSLRRGLDLFQMVQTESIVARLGRYAIQFARAALDAAVWFSFAISALFGYLVTRRRRWLALFGATTFVTMLAGDFFVGGSDQYLKQVGSSFILLAMTVCVTLPAWRQRRMSAILVTGLIALPYSVAVGTGNSIFTQVIVSLAPWGALAAVLANIQLAHKSDRFVAAILFIGLVTSVSAQIFTSGFRMPYHMSQPIAAQAERVHVRDLGFVLVDAGTRQFVADMEGAARKCAIPRMLLSSGSTTFLVLH